MELALAIIFIGGVVFSGYLLSFLFEKVRIPEVLPLFLIGIFIGPVGGFVDLSFFGGLGEIFATLVLLLILFTGGINIHFRELLHSFPKSTLLVLMTFLSTIVLVVPLAFVLFHVPPIMGAIMGVIIGGTSTAVVIPLAKSLRLREKTQTTLGVESNLNDVLTVVLVFGLASLLHSEEFSAAGIAGEFLLTVFSSVAIGMASAYVWSHILKRVRDVQHHIFMTPAFLLLVFGVAEFLSGNGFLAAFAFAITLGNLEHIRIRLPHMFGGIHNFSFTQEERKFYEASSFLFKTFFFVYIGISLNIQNTTFLIWGALFMALLFALRVLIVKAVLGSSLSPRERLFVSGIFPKGVAGIAILAILGDQLLQDLSYPVILFSILYTSAFVFFAHYIAPFKEDAVPEPELQREQPQ